MTPLRHKSELWVAAYHRAFDLDVRAAHETIDCVWRGYPAWIDDHAHDRALPDLKIQRCKWPERKWWVEVKHSEKGTWFPGSQKRAAVIRTRQLESYRDFVRQRGQEVDIWFLDGRANSTRIATPEHILSHGTAIEAVGERCMIIPWNEMERGPTPNLMEMLWQDEQRDQGRDIPLDPSFPPSIGECIVDWINEEFPDWCNDAPKEDSEPPNPMS